MEEDDKGLDRVFFFEGRSAVFLVSDKAHRIHAFDDRPIRSVSVGEEHSAWIVLKNGEAYSFGKGNAGKLGYDESINNAATFLQPRKLDTSTIFVDARISYNHSLLLSDDGRMYSCGFGGEDGRLGQPDHSKETRHNPTPIDTFLEEDNNKAKRIKSIAVGRFHNLCISDGGCVYAFGHNLGYMLGDGWECHNIYLPSPLPDFSAIRIKQVSTSNFGHMCLSEEGVVYYADTLVCRRWQTYPGLNGVKVRFISSGLGANCLAITDDGGLYTWGVGQKGILGHGQQRVASPKLVETPIGAGTKFATFAMHTLYIIDVEGKLYVSGTFLGRQFLVPTLIPTPSRVVSVAGGLHSSLIAFDRCGMDTLLDICIWKVKCMKLYRPDVVGCPQLPDDLEQMIGFKKT